MRHSARGFSLIEAMVVVALLGIIAAIAVPNFLPELRKANVENSAESVAAFIGRARLEAMTSKRCVRVWIDSTNPRRMVAERLNTFDCDQTANVFPPGMSNGLDGSGLFWVPLVGGDLRLENPGITINMTTSPAKPPASTASCQTVKLASVSGTPAGHPCTEIVFRPNGRVWHQNTFIAVTGTNPTADANDAVLKIAHLQDAALFRLVLVNSNGLICALERGESLTADPNGDFRCP
jgi:prepilin-type N-terminal cleavage/methylation domain-containing protein